MLPKERQSPSTRFASCKAAAFMTSSFDDSRHLLKSALQVPIRTDPTSPLVAPTAERRVDTQSWARRIDLNVRLAARKPLIQNLIAYAIAAAIVCFAARGVSLRQVVNATSHATLWLFIVASLGGFLCWFLGETVLYSRLFSYFHGSTGSIELLPTMSAVYFLQIVNSYVASGAFVLFLHARKRAPWIMAGCTLLFQAYLDAMLLAALALFAIALVPTSPIRLGLNYAAGVVSAGCFIASFFLLWGKRLSTGNWLRWIYDRPSMASFRTAQPSQYFKLLGIRFLIVLGSGVALYGQFVSFHIGVSLAQTLAMTPFIVAVGNSALSPGGIGTTQLVFTLAFARFASKNDLFALSLAVTAFNFLVRVPMGLAMRTPLEDEAAKVESDFATAYGVG
ncbi:MAG: lysylphosphatidylglycerol synthase domain-containing protein [Candidatus Binatus sp.]|uniref:lysylphosphatidylglycerol synthase domain-containing protein n=1 Tax=Candidatus Binatus sp. TaxID=2811406 RepID=UPI003C716012